MTNSGTERDVYPEKVKPKVLVWTICAVAVALGLAAALFQGLTYFEGTAKDACLARLRDKLGGEVDESLVSVTRPETFFPRPLEKHFRSTCTYKGVTVVLESTPGSKWRVVEVSGLD